MADSEHVALVRGGVEAVNAFAAENRKASLDLTGAVLHGIDLRDAILRGAKLGGANLRDADLRNTSLNSADMRECDLRGADLTGANMHRTSLIGADLRGAKLAALGVGSQRMCIAPATFQGARWERDELERILEMINLNPDWQVQYEIVPRDDPGNSSNASD